MNIATGLLKKQIKHVEWMPKTVAFQYASALYSQKFNITVPYIYPVAPYLILSGNIGKTDVQTTYKFIQWCAMNYEKIWWVPGPVEEHLDKMQSIIMDINKNFPKNRVYLGIHSSTILPDYNIQILGLGCGSPLTSTQKSLLQKSNPATKTLILGHRDIDKKMIMNAMIPGLTTNTIKAYFLGDYEPNKRTTTPILCNPLFINGKYNKRYSPVAVYDLPLDVFGGVKENVDDSDMYNSRGLLPAY